MFILRHNMCHLAPMLPKYQNSTSYYYSLELKFLIDLRDDCHNIKQTLQSQNHSLNVYRTTLVVI